MLPESHEAPKSPRGDYIRLALGLGPIIGLFLASVFAPLPYAPTTPDTSVISVAPNGSHWFGTDANGFDVFSRTIEAARIDLPLAFGGVLLAMVIGVPIGLAVSKESWLSNIVMRGVDALQSLPLLIVTVAVVALAGDHFYDVILAMVLVIAPGFIRLVRAGAVVIRSKRYVEAATATGSSEARILRVHVLPNVLNLVLTQLTLGVGLAIVVIAGLNFLGVGVDPPTPTWGGMIFDGAGVINQGQWWVALFPSLAILVVISCVNLTARVVEDLTQAR
ncbi:ABC transporter permease subunit [Amycolatopsis balhimycina]